MFTEKMQVTDLATQFQDGVYLVFLMGLLEGYFVPLYSVNLQTTQFNEKVLYSHIITNKEWNDSSKCI